MATITFDMPTDWEEELKLAARRHGKDVAAFLRDSIRQQLRRDVLPEDEATLLTVINAPIAPEARQKRDTLLAAKVTRPLTPEEEATLSDLIDTVEIANAKRWQAIVELADRRQLSLPEMTRELQIPFP